MGASNFNFTSGPYHKNCLLRPCTLWKDCRTENTVKQGRSKQFSWYGPKSKLAPLKKKLRNPQIFFSDFGAEIAPSSVKMAPPFLPCFFGGGCKQWYFGQICAPLTISLRAAAPLAPPCYGLAVKFCYNELVYNELPVKVNKKCFGWFRLTYQLIFLVITKGTLVNNFYYYLEMSGGQEIEFQVKVWNMNFDLLKLDLFIISLRNVIKRTFSNFKMKQNKRCTIF